MVLVLEVSWVHDSAVAGDYSNSRVHISISYNAL